MTVRRWVSLFAGAGILAAGKAWTASIDDPLYLYDFEWFLKLTPGEAVFAWRYLVSGGLGAAALAWGLRPLLGGPVATMAGADPRRITLGLALLGPLLVLGVAEGVLMGQMVTDDEYAYAFQAGALLDGRAAHPAPEMPEFFTNVFVKAAHGRWFGQYPPGHPLVLAAGVAAGMPRLVPAILFAINLLLSGAVLRRVAGPGWAAVGVSLLCFSPLFLLTGSTLLSHPTAYCGLALALWSALRVLEGGGTGWGTLCGLGTGLLFLARPWTGVTLGLFPAGFLLLGAIRARRPGPVAGGLGAAVACFGFFLLYNWGATGDPLLTGYDAVRGPGMSEFGFATIVPGVHDHTPAQGLRNAGLLGIRFHFWSLGWPVAVVPAIFAFLPFAGPGEGRRRWPAWAALAMLGVGLLSYVPYWSMGVNDTGPVKTYELLLPFGVLTTMGLRNWASRNGPAPAAAWVLASLLAAAMLFWPPHLGHLRDVAAHVAKPLRMIEEEAETPALVFVSSMQARPGRSWVFGHPNPRPGLEDPVLYVRDLGRRNMEYARLHPGRTAYRLVFEGSEPELEPLPGGRR